MDGFKSGRIGLNPNATGKAMANLKVDKSQMKHLLDTLYSGSVHQFLDEWHVRFGNEPNKATVHRWLNGENLPSSMNYCKLCGLLDIDPFVLLKFHEIPFIDFYRITRALKNQRWENIKTLVFVEDFIGDHASWPPDKFALEFYNRKWHFNDFKHDATIRKNFYQEIKLTSLLSSDTEIPVTYHFAFLNQIPFVYWNHYGFVIRYQSQHRLFHINGSSESFEQDNEQSIARVETWFGEYGADFRIASIHPFECKLVNAASSNSKPKLRFSA